MNDHLPKPIQGEPADTILAKVVREELEKHPEVEPTTLKRDVFGCHPPAVRQSRETTEPLVLPAIQDGQNPLWPPGLIEAMRRGLTIKVSDPRVCSIELLCAYTGQKFSLVQAFNLVEGWFERVIPYPDTGYGGLPRLVLDERGNLMCERVLRPMSVRLVATAAHE